MAKAVETTEAALTLLSEESEPRLFLCARFNLAKFFVERGRYEAGSELLRADAAAYLKRARGNPELRFSEEG